MRAFDIRDYRRDDPIEFDNLKKRFIHNKRYKKAVKKYEQHFRFAVDGKKL